ncbi:hypothetical protein pb186bvf_015719 [Paramecium bursaria]
MIQNSHMKTTYRSGFLPKIQQKLKDTQSIFQSLDADKVRPRNLDFSNIQRTTATAKPRSRSNQRTWLTPITAALGSIQITKMYLNRLIQTLIKQLKSDIEYIIDNFQKLFEQISYIISVNMIQLYQIKLEYYYDG